MSKALRDLPIGVFDSGVGGLTVLNALRTSLPGESLIYLGDTARVPYGTKSALSVTRYAEQAARSLVNRGVKMLIIACNTASAVAVEPLQACFPNIPVIGVIEPGAQACCDATVNGHVGVIATEGTVNNQAYHKAILARRPEVRIRAQACSLFVALAEEGWHSGELVEAIIERCLAPLKQTQASSESLDTLVLGCTHFPALKEAIGRVMGPQVSLIDSAQTTADTVKVHLARADLLSERRQGQVDFMVTDGPERFARVAPNFFVSPINAAEIELVDIQHYTAR